MKPPSYQTITSIIRRMKASTSPCPLDKISIICFKRCPYLRSFLTEIIRVIWLSGRVPPEWKKAATILIHKKGSTDDPANFRPITLESVPLKIFTSCLRNSMFNFLKKNNFIENQIQKGFTSNISGTIEHTSFMSHVIDKARIKQRSLVITLLDLKNAFGEVHHNLIKSVLSYHHIPSHVQALISNLYLDFKTSIITEEFQTPAISVRRGVLQGDCLSPLLFNLCFNTFIQFIKAEKYQHLGFSVHDGSDRMFQPVHWFQFADDAAVITSGEKENQILLNCFTRWCQWANFVIRVDKCVSFGVKKYSTRSIQFQPKLLIDKQLVPPVKNGESFKYLGRYFDFDMTNELHKSKLLSLFSTLMKGIDDLPLHPKNKLLVYHRYVLSKVSWHFTVADIPRTWVTENLDNLVSRYIRSWLDLPVSATLTSLALTQKQFGLNLQMPSVKFTQCQTVSRNILRSSPNANVQALWKNTSTGPNLQYDIYRNTREVLKAVKLGNRERLTHNLPSQGALLSFLLDHSLKKLNGMWSGVQSNLPVNIYNFTIKYLSNTLPTRKNLCLWKLRQSSDCQFCLLPETLLHVVAGCKVYLEQGRYTWRHNSVLSFLATSLKVVEGSSLYADIPGFPSPSIITGDALRPDLLLKTKDNCLYILELTIGFETNLSNNAERKRLKYSRLVSDLRSQYKSVTFVNLSMSSLGIYANSCLSFLKMCDSLSIDNQHKRFLISKLSTISIRTTYYIFCCRDKPWNNPDLHCF